MRSKYNEKYLNYHNHLKFPINVAMRARPKIPCHKTDLGGEIKLHWARFNLLDRNFPGKTVRLQFNYVFSVEAQRKSSRGYGAVWSVSGGLLVSSGLIL